MSPRPLVPFLLAALAAVALTLALAPSARAAELAVLAPSCPEVALEHPFRPWLDPMPYTLIAAGDFEAGTRGWTLDGARVVSGNEPWRVRSSNDSRSLELPSGTAARTPAVCAGVEEPTLRLFVRATGDATSALAIEVLFEDLIGRPWALPIALVPAASDWQPTAPHPVVADLLALLREPGAPLSFRFRPVGEADWQIDDVYLDPQRRS